MGVRDLPFTVSTERHDYKAEQWCIDQFGPRWIAIDRRDGNWTRFWVGPASPKTYEWHFRNEKDMMMFILRWL